MREHHGLSAVHRDPQTGENYLRIPFAEPEPACRILFAGAPKRLLWPELIYCNSCHVFNRPLQPAIMAAHARTFVGGKVNLLIGGSEEVCKCSWTRILKKPTPTGTALAACEKQNYPAVGCHVISGDLGRFKPVP